MGQKQSHINLNSTFIHMHHKNNKSKYICIKNNPLCARKYDE